MRSLSSSTDRLTRLRVTGFRSLADVTLDLSGLTVLIGANGSGKSSLIEACEVLRHLGSDPAGRLQQVFAAHPSPVHLGSKAMEFAVQIEGAGPRLDYSFAIERTDSSLAITEEVLLLHADDGAASTTIVQRDAAGAVIHDAKEQKQVAVNSFADRLLVAQYGALPPRKGRPTSAEQAMRRVGEALAAIDVQLPFEVIPTWGSQRFGRRSASREASVVQPADRLEPLAGNLANAIARLKEESTEHWLTTMDYVRLGLGDDVDSIVLRADAAGGQHALGIRYKSLGEVVPAACLSDGTLAYLAFVALLRRPTRRSLLAVDDAEIHFHPGLLTRVIGMLESIGRTCPVLVSTHSDRLLDALQEPARSTVLCELDHARRTRFRRPDPAALGQWLRDFRGLGDLRSAGFESAVMAACEPIIQAP